MGTAASIDVVVVAAVVAVVVAVVTLTLPSLALLNKGSTAAAVVVVSSSGSRLAFVNATAAVGPVSVLTRTLVGSGSSVTSGRAMGATVPCVGAT